MSTTKSPHISSPPTSTSSTPKPSAGPTGKLPSPSTSTSTTASKRLLQELNQLRASEPASTRTSLPTNPGGGGGSSSAERSPIERLGPVSDGDFFHWEAVLSGRGLGGGYDEGRWLVDISVKGGGESGGGGAGGVYPNRPPLVRFLTKVVAANVGFESGEVCLDLLKDAWSPAYTLKMTVEAIWQMLAAPGVDSPLNVDIAALIRQGDSVGAEAVVRWACDEWRYEGR